MSSDNENNSDEINEKNKTKKINLDEEEYEGEENDEIDDTFSQEKEKDNDSDNEKSELEEKQIGKNDNNESEDSDENNESSESKDNPENELSEEMMLKEEIENVDFKSLLKVKAKLSYENSKKSKSMNDKKKFNKNSILDKMDKINRDKKKAEPREYSALLRPEYQFKNRDKSKNNSSLLHKKFSRDPRFDDISGNLNEEKFKKNFNFVNNMAKDYVDKLQKVKKSKKFKKKLTEQQYELLKKQNNYVKGWINQQKQKQIKTDIKKEIDKENKDRVQKGQKPIYVNNNKLNKYIKNQKNENK